MMTGLPNWKSASVALVVLIACADDPQRPSRTAEAPDDPMLFPLNIGDRSEYFLTYLATLQNLSGEDVIPPVYLEANSTREIISTEMRFGREYLVQQEMAYAEDGVDTVYVWDRYREDETGLYRLDIPEDLPPNVPYGGVDPGEETVLSYPLEEGKEWLRFKGGRTKTLVASIGKVQTPAGETTGYELQIDTGSTRDETLTVWMGACGMLSRTLHVEVFADSPTGMLQFVSHETQTLLGVQLAREGNCTLSPPALR